MMKPAQSTRFLSLSHPFSRPFGMNLASTGPKTSIITSSIPRYSIALYSYSMVNINSAMSSPSAVKPE